MTQLINDIGIPHAVKVVAAMTFYCDYFWHHCRRLCSFDRTQHFLQILHPEMDDDNCLTLGFLGTKELTINGWMFCADHGREWCHRCTVDHRMTNNYNVGDIYTISG